MIFGNKLNISLLECNVIWNDKQANLKQLENNLDLIPKGTDIVVLPELFSTGFYLEKPNEMKELAERNTENTILTLKKFAKKHKIAICGSYMARTADKIYNRAFFIESSGDETFYDKRHTYNIGGEDSFFTAGNSKPLVIRYRGWNILIAVCYDLKFPVWLRNTNCKYDVIIVVANWPKAQDYEWEHLLIARAIENLCYVCGCNRIGKSPYGIEYIGNSMFVDFKGKITKIKDTNNSILSTSLSSEKLSSFRKNYPIWKDFDQFELKKI